MRLLGLVGVGLWDSGSCTVSRLHLQRQHASLIEYMRGALCCAGSSGDAMTEVVSVARQPQKGDGFPGLYATSLPEQLFQTSELASLTSQWANATQVVAVDLDRGSASLWASSAGAAAEGSCAVLSSYKGEPC